MMMTTTMAAAARIPMRFERVAAAFDTDVARVRLCESSGSDHSPESSSTDLSDLVKSFMEKNERGGEGEGNEARECNDKDEVREDLLEHEKCEWSDEFDSHEKEEKLKMLFEGSEDDRNAKEKIIREVEVAYGLIGDKSSPEFKRRLMTWLREKGFDAGLCKSKWEKSGRFPGGDYEYIDINIKGKRYIIEVSLVGEFEIARPTHHYTSLLQVFPLIFIGKVEEMKKIVRLMCTAIKASMKSMDLFVPPWRRHVYMKAKWFGSYRRTTNEVSIKKVVTSNYYEGGSGRFCINGFEAKTPVKPYICRDDYGRTKGGLRIGLLASTLNS